MSFLFTVLSWIKLLKVACFELQLLHQMDTENETYLPVWLLSFRASGQMHQEQCAVGFPALTKPEIHCTSSIIGWAKGQYAIHPSNWTCYPLGVYTLYSIILQCQYLFSLRLNQCVISTAPQWGTVRISSISTSHNDSLYLLKWQR